MWFIVFSWQDLKIQIFLKEHLKYLEYIFFKLQGIKEIKRKFEMLDFRVFSLCIPQSKKFP